MAARALKWGVVESRSGSPLSSPFLPQAVVRVFLPTSFSHRTGALQSVCCGCVHNPKSKKSPTRKGHSHFLMHQKSWIRAGRAKRGGAGLRKGTETYTSFSCPRPPLLLSPCSCFPGFISILLREVIGYAYLSISSTLFTCLTTRRLRGAIIFSFL